MCTLLNEGEKVVADNGYDFDKCITSKGVRDNDKAAQTRIRAQHESCKARIKSFCTIKKAFMNCVQHHSVVFHAVSKLVALAIEAEQILFKV